MSLQIQLLGVFAIVVLVLLAAVVRRKMIREKTAQERNDSWDAARPTAVWGPARVRLADEGWFDIPADVVYVPPQTAARIMRSLGNRIEPEFLGLAVGSKVDDEWLATLSFIRTGYVAERDAKRMRPLGFLQSYKRETAHHNMERAPRGLTTLEVTGWIEPPTYDSTTRRLVWSIVARESGRAVGRVNYNAFLLGREGYYDLNFITTEEKIDAEKTLILKLLAAVHFDQGKRYEDFNAMTDKMAAFGVATLVGG
jgi:uncharacterized membrane-anchored protein